MEQAAIDNRGVSGTIARDVEPVRPGVFPPEVQLVISALEAGPRPVVDRHKLPRVVHRTVAELKLFSDAPGAEPHTLYTRHVNPKAVGFVVDRPLPLSHGGVVVLRSLDGRRLLRIFCTVLRCRPVTERWYEGAVYFNRPQEQFAAE